MNSYSVILQTLQSGGENINEDWLSFKVKRGVLQREDTLKEIVRLLDLCTPDEEKLILEVARMVKIGLYNKTHLMMLTLIVAQKTIQTIEITS